MGMKFRIRIFKYLIGFGYRYEVISNQLTVSDSFRLRSVVIFVLLPFETLTFRFISSAGC